MTGSLSLDYNIEQLSQDNTAKLKHCPNARLMGEMVHDEKRLHKSFRLSCKQWSCPHCAPRNLRKLRDMLERAITGYFGSDQARRYGVKMLTFTLPGAEFREKHTTEQAEKIFKGNLSKVMRHTREKFGCDWVWVREYQRGDWVHVHALVLGGNTWEMGILTYVRGLWSYRYGMGNVDIKIVEHASHAIRYITKYMAKKPSAGVKGFRVYSMSQGIRDYIAIVKQIARNTGWTLVRLMGIREDGTLSQPFYDLIARKFPLRRKRDTVYSGAY